MANEMAATASFDQFCPVAVGLDALGDRWGVLLMRDMLWAGPQSRVGLLERNPSLDENTIDPVIDRLVARGLIAQMDEPKARYALTDKGEGISDVIAALFDFGMPLLDEIAVNEWMLAYSIADCSRRKRLDLLEVEQRYLVRVVVDQADLCVELSPGMLRVVDGQQPQATLRMAGRTLASILGGVSPIASLIRDGDIEVSGDQAAADALLAMLPADH